MDDDPMEILGKPATDDEGNIIDVEDLRYWQVELTDCMRIFGGLSMIGVAVGLGAQVGTGADSFVAGVTTSAIFGAVFGYLYYAMIWRLSDLVRADQLQAARMRRLEYLRTRQEAAELEALEEARRSGEIEALRRLQEGLDG